MDILHDFFNNIYVKLLIVFILALLTTFAHDIDILKDGAIVYITMIILLLLIYTREHFGIIMLMMALLVLSYNNVVTRKKNV